MGRFNSFLYRVRRVIYCHCVLFCAEVVFIQDLFAWFLCGIKLKEIEDMKIKFKLIIIVLALGSFLLLSGCNTTEGLGKDMEIGGKNLQKSAIDSKNDNTK